MSEQTEDELTAEIMGWASGLQQTVDAFAQKAKRWNTETCPICKSSLNPADPTNAGHRSPFEITHQSQSKLQWLTGHCGECMLSPVEVQEDEIPKWIWVRLPGTMARIGDYGFTLRAEGATLQEVIDYLLGKHPELKAEMLEASSLVLPPSLLESSVNWVPVSSSQGLETPVKGGDYVKLPAQAFL
uniref:hypothetical protein n=1 Tax=Sphingomonas sp. TaxID=28214 RepID=UPI0025D76193|nr:hypothetical protein [Sphingomonas sp.]